MYIFFLSGEKVGTSKKKLSSEVGESQSFCAGSLRSIFRVDYDLGSPYTAGVDWFKARCDLHVPHWKKGLFLLWCIHSSGMNP